MTAQRRCRGRAALATLVLLVLAALTACGERGTSDTKSPVRHTPSDRNEVTEGLTSIAGTEIESQLQQIAGVCLDQKNLGDRSILLENRIVVTPLEIGFSPTSSGSDGQAVEGERLTVGPGGVLLERYRRVPSASAPEPVAQEFVNDNVAALSVWRSGKREVVATRREPPGDDPNEPLKPLDTSVPCTLPSAVSIVLGEAAAGRPVSITRAPRSDSEPIPSASVDSAPLVVLDDRGKILQAGVCQGVNYGTMCYESSISWDGAGDGPAPPDLNDAEWVSADTYSERRARAMEVEGPTPGR